jgi:hypothetical protein
VLTGVFVFVAFATTVQPVGRGQIKATTGDLSGLLQAVEPAVLDTGWVRRYNGPGNSADRANAMQVDPAGNVFVTGHSITPQGTDCVTLKYDTDGNILWERSYRGSSDSMDVSVKLVLDGAGNVYVAGLSLFPTCDYFTLKYDNDGTLKWSRRYNGPGNRDDAPSGLAVDRAGNIYVTGYSDGVGTNRDFATLKYDSAGTLIWERRYDGPLSKSDSPSSVAVDSNFNVFVTGGAASDSIDSGEFGYIYIPEFATLKYDSSGNLLWTRLYKGPGHGIHFASAMKIDALGNACITGQSDGGLGAFYDYATLKYDPDGNLLWERRYDGPSHLFDEPFALQTDAVGNVYVTGTSGGGEMVTGRDFATVKYAADGTQLWVQRYTGPGAGYDDAVDLRVGANGMVFVTGKSPDSSLSNDYATLVYNADGILLWVSRYDGPAHRVDEPAAIGIDATGDVFVSGGSDGGSPTGWDFATVKYTPCACDWARGDVEQDGVIDVFDVILLIQISFIGYPIPDPDPLCPNDVSDVNCDGPTDVFDVLNLIDIAFRGAIACDPCGR